MIKDLRNVLIAVVLTNACIIMGLMATGSDMRASARATVLEPAVRLMRPVHDDSWRPMLLAYQFKKDSPKGDLYSLFFEKQIKFQYPPTSLIFFDLIPSSLTKLQEGSFGPEFRSWVSLFSWGALIMTAILSAMILGAKGPAIILCGVSAFLFYPLTIGYELGQIQVFLNALAALALWAILKKKDALSGAVIGLCCLVKPQWSVFLIWALVRKRWRFASAMGLVCVAGLVVSVMQFGWHDHLRYLDVLKMISRQGEMFWPNQSMNGLMNRFLQYGSFKFFAPYHPVVYGMTLLSSALIFVLALWPMSRRAMPEALEVDFAVVLMAATMASPVAWGHHYGVLFPVFAMALPLLKRNKILGEATLPLLLVSYLAISQVMVRPDILYADRWFGLLGSHVYAGGWALFLLLITLRQKLTIHEGVRTL